MKEIKQFKNRQEVDLVCEVETFNGDKVTLNLKPGTIINGYLINKFTNRVYSLSSEMVQSKYGDKKGVVKEDANSTAFTVYAHALELIYDQNNEFFLKEIAPEFLVEIFEWVRDELTGLAKKPQK